MRRSLVWVFIAVSSIVALAFVVPLGVAVRTTAIDRAIDRARTDSAAIVPAVVADRSRAGLVQVISGTEAGSTGRLTVVLPDGAMIGRQVEDRTRLEAALSAGTSSIGDIEGGREVVTAIIDEQGRRSAVRVFVPSSQLHSGLLTAWLVLFLVALALVGLSVLAADRLAQTIVGPTKRLARAARSLGDGDLTIRVDPAGPTELVELSHAFNDLAGRVTAMLDTERELMAELSHRLRTPLTALGMRVDDVEDPEVAAALKADVERLTGVVDTLINEARRRPRERQELSVAPVAVVARRVEFWAVLAADQERPWKFERSSGQARVGLSEAELVAALDVLIENVFAHTDEGTGLWVWVAHEDDCVRIGVRDEGPGFDPALVSAGRSDAGSTGLGLSIAESTAERAGGHLHVSRPVDGGMVVELVMPALSATDVALDDHH